MHQYFDRLEQVAIVFLKNYVHNSIAFGIIVEFCLSFQFNNSRMHLMCSPNEIEDRKKQEIKSFKSVSLQMWIDWIS